MEAEIPYMQGTRIGVKIGLMKRTAIEDNYLE